MDNPSTTLGIIQWPSLTTTPSEHLLLGTETLGATTSTMAGPFNPSQLESFGGGYIEISTEEQTPVAPSQNVNSTGSPKIRIHNIPNAPAVDGKSNNGNSSRCSIQHQPT
ncbi:hypothetical protein L204_105820 [Cryptococcus depauperatus]|nr:hypothetical protein L204_06091 [Cryptococcus depauperatus CBS 7855]